jgi:hypothetical protein
MYLFDPDRGRSRRVRLRDKAVRGFHLLGRQGNKQIRNAGNHLIGRIYELRSSIRDRSHEVSDDILSTASARNSDAMSAICACSISACRMAV